MSNLLLATETSNVIEIINSIKWPVFGFIAFLFLLKPLKDLVGRITKVGYGNKSIEASQQNAIKLEEQDTSQIDRAINLFRPETIQTFMEAVEQETELKKLKNDAEKVERLSNYACIIYIMRHFDNIYNSIFGSQLRILEKLNTLRPASRESLKYLYDAAKTSNPSFFDNYSYDDYLGYLFSFNLIREDNNKISITILGVDFLKYLTETNKDVYKTN